MSYILWLYVIFTKQSTRDEQGEKKMHFMGFYENLSASLYRSLCVYIFVSNSNVCTLNERSSIRIPMVIDTLNIKVNVYAYFQSIHKWFKEKTKRNVCVCANRTLLIQNGFFLHIDNVKNKADQPIVSNRSINRFYINKKKYICQEKEISKEIHTNNFFFLIRLRFFGEGVSFFALNISIFTLVVFSALSSLWTCYDFWCTFKVLERSYKHNK